MLANPLLGLNYPPRILEFSTPIWAACSAKICLKGYIEKKGVVRHSNSAGGVYIVTTLLRALLSIRVKSYKQAKTLTPCFTSRNVFQDDNQRRNTELCSRTTTQ